MFKVITILSIFICCIFSNSYLKIYKYGKYHFRILNTKTLDTIYKFDYDTTSNVFYDSTYKRYLDTSSTTAERFSNGSLEYVEHYVILNFYYRLEQKFYYGVGSNSHDNLILYKYEILDDSIQYLNQYSCNNILTERHFTIINAIYDNSNNRIIIDYSTPNPLQYIEMKHLEPLKKTVTIDLEKI